MISALVAVCRLIFFVLLTTLVFTVFVVGSVFTFWHRATQQRLRFAIFRIWAVVFARVIGMRVRVKGIPPSGPFLLIVNHLSYLDIVVLASCVRAVFVAKSEIAGWPFLGPMVRSMKTIFINRAKHRDLLNANQEINAALNRGEGVIVFPEGTSSDGSDVLPIRPSLLLNAINRNQPVYFARISYRTPTGSAAAGRAICWWGDMTFLPHLFGVFRLSGFKALVHFGAKTLIAPDRKSLALELRDEIRALDVTV